MAVALGAIGLCQLLPGLAGLPLLLPIAVWLGRGARRLRPVPRTALDIPIILFGGTAVLGAIVAYDPAAAWNKVWLIAGGIVLFYAVARQPQENLWPIAGFLVLSAALLSTAVLLTRILGQAGSLPSSAAGWWMAAAQKLLRAPAVEVVQGILTLLLAFPIALALRGFKSGHRGLGALAALAGVVTVSGLASTGSMSAWLSLIGSCVLACLFGLGLLSRKRRLTTVVLLALAVVGATAIVPGALARMSQGLYAAQVSRLPGMTDVLSRVEVARQSRYLVEDYIWTGAGLASFPGQYSQYIRVVPVASQDGSHNTLLDVVLEQGVFGLLALLWIWAGSIGLLVDGRLASDTDDTGLLAAAAFSALSLLALHGLAEDPLYGSRAAPLLFLLPGIAVALAGRTPDSTGDARPSALVPWRISSRAKVPIAAGLALILIAAGVGFGKAIMSSLQSNLGSVEMARVQLSDWPTGEWEDGRTASRLRLAEARFESALRWEMANRTAHYRLGLIHLLSREFDDAVGHLSQAQLLSPHHRGVRKTLGYSLAWAGSLDQAASILAGIPEAQQELEIYVWWWGTQDRPDLAAQAERVASLLPAP